jgi:DNA-directed RNA polymerase specialized sigma24 family protein
MAETSVWPEIESLYRSEFNQFVRVAQAITGDHDTGLESVQEGFADALRNAGKWKGRGPLEAWVWRCVVNRARKSWRRPVVETRSDERGNGSDDSTGSRWAPCRRLCMLRTPPCVWRWRRVRA